MHGFPVILHLEADGPAEPPGNVEEPLDDQNPFLLWEALVSCTPWVTIPLPYPNTHM